MSEKQPVFIINSMVPERVIKDYDTGADRKMSPREEFHWVTYSYEEAIFTINEKYMSMVTVDSPRFSTMEIGSIENPYNRSNSESGSSTIVTFYSSLDKEKTRPQRWKITLRFVEQESGLPIRLGTTVIRKSTNEIGIVTSIDRGNAMVQFSEGITKIRRYFEKQGSIEDEDRGLLLPISSLEKARRLSYLVLGTFGAYNDDEYPPFVHIASTMEDVESFMIKKYEKSYSDDKPGSTKRSFFVKANECMFISKGSCIYEGAETRKGTAFNFGFDINIDSTIGLYGGPAVYNVRIISADL